MEGIHAMLEADHMRLTPADKGELQASRQRKRVYDIMQAAMDRSPTTCAPPFSPPSVCTLSDR